MTIYNLGSINADHFYSVPHLPAAGETIAATSHSVGLGGKGANQSVAAARAGAHVVHIGAVGADGDWAVQRMAKYGVDTAHIATVQSPTAHAIINVDPDGENAIVIYSGANLAQSNTHIAAALTGASQGDFLILQNETSHQVEAAKIARDLGLRIVYSAAPFEIEPTRAILPFVDILIVNTVEAAQLETALSTPLLSLPVANILVTRGADGADWIDTSSGETVSVSAFPVTPIDTTGAGDTFAGYMVAGLSENMAPMAAMRFAAAAAAIKVTRKGTADAIPDRADVKQFLASN